MDRSRDTDKSMCWMQGAGKAMLESKKALFQRMHERVSHKNVLPLFPSIPRVK